MTLQPHEIEALAVDVADLEHTLTTAPLTGVMAWHTANTSQRHALQQLQRFKTVIVSGGNRSGKTYLLRAALVALAIGSDHPHAQLFWRNNGCDPSCFPEGPGDAYIIALTSNDSLRYHRKDVEALLPAGSYKWYNRNGRGEARVEVTCPGWPTPATIWFKSDDQGEKAVQGDAVRAILHDEEGDTNEVWEEAGVRLLDYDGWHLMANTPLKGRTWLWEAYVRETPDDVAYCEIWTEDNPYLPPSAVGKLAKRNKAGARLRGQWEVAEGLVYGGNEHRQGWSRARHVVTRERWRRLHPTVPWPDDEPHPRFPGDWPRFRGQDFGTVNPSCTQWWVYDPEGHRILYRQIYATGWTTERLAREIILAEGGDPDADPIDHGPEPIEHAWADPAGAQQMVDLHMLWGIGYAPAIKDWESGRDAMMEALDNGADGEPRLWVLEGVAPDFVVEIEGYRYSDKPAGAKNADERPIKKNDHAMDTARYTLLGIRIWEG